MATSRRLSQLIFIILNSGCLRRVRVLTFHVICGKRTSFLTALRFETDEVTQHPLQRGNVGKLFTVTKEVALFEVLKSHRAFKETDSELLCRIVVQQSRVEPCGLRKLLSSRTCMRMRVN